MQINPADQESIIRDLASCLLTNIIRDGVLDLKNCISITNELRQRGQIRPPAINSDDRPDLTDLPAPYELRAILNLRGRGAATILHYLMMNEDRLYSTKELTSALILSASSVRVFVSALRKALREINLDDVVETQYGVGYCVSRQGAAKVIQYIRANNAALSKTAPDLPLAIDTLPSAIEGQTLMDAHE